MSAKKVGFGWKSLVLILLAVAMCFASFAFAACGEPDEPSGKEVKSIAVTKTPTKTEYKVGETFSAEGGEITVTYTDGSTEVVKMTDKSVTIQEVNIALDDDVTEGKIVVRLSYGGKNTNGEREYHKRYVRLELRGRYRCGAPDQCRRDGARAR